VIAVCVRDQNQVRLRQSVVPIGTHRIYIDHLAGLFDHQAGMVDDGQPDGALARQALIHGAL